MRTATHREAGYIVLVLLILMTLVSSILLLGANTQQAQHLRNREVAERRAYLIEAAQQIRAWYRANPGTLDAQPGVLDTTGLLTAAGVRSRVGLRAATSTRLTRGELSFHDVVLWLPAAEPDASRFDPTTGAFTPGPSVAFVRVSGAEIQAEAVASTRRALADGAGALEAYFHARAKLDGEEVRVNYFRPDASCAGLPGEMPCLDTYAAVERVDWAAAGVDGLPQRDAWGSALEVSNLLDSSTATPPYSMALRARTPWGALLQVQAVQRL
jgi:hypothetical protein